jgi:Subtilisin-like serine proteases
MASDSRTTGRYIVLLRPDKPRSSVRRLTELTGVKVVHSRGRDPKPRAPAEKCAIVFDHIGVALLYCSADAGRTIARAAAEGDHTILAVEPERRVHAWGMGHDPLRDAYLKGYRDGVEDLVRRLTQGDGDTPLQLPVIAPVNATWGVTAVGADRAPYTGKGVRIAILDTGLDLDHPDFRGRSITPRSFIEGESQQDGNGHGTHCAGIAAGPAAPDGVPRYGVASQAELFIGKVLSDEGGGSDGSVLQGIDWAIENQCQIISMSLGSPAQAGESHSAVFETVAQRALQAGTLIVAAAGNESQRPEHIAPVGHPANCPSILAVGAIDENMRVAPFSCGGLSPGGGEVDLSAPGVDIASSWPMPQGHHTISGTSMATPFVAGIAALHAEAGPGLRAAALAERLAETARRLEEPPRDVGAGLVQAPQGNTGRSNDSPVHALPRIDRKT